MTCFVRSEIGMYSSPLRLANEGRTPRTRRRQPAAEQALSLAVQGPITVEDCLFFKEAKQHQI